MDQKLKRSIQTLVSDYPENGLLQHITLALGEYEPNDFEFIDNDTLSDALELHIEQLQIDDSIKNGFQDGEEH